MKDELNDAWSANTVEEARRRMKILIRRLVERGYSKAADLLEQEGEDTLACFAFSKAHRRRIKSTNMLERQNEEIRRCTRPIRIFPNQASALRLISAVCMERSEEWMTGRRYLNMDIAVPEKEAERKTVRSRETELALT